MISDYYLSRIKKKAFDLYDDIFTGHFNILSVASLNFSIKNFQKNDFNIELEDEVLTISLDIEIDTKNINYTRREFNYNSFKRAFNLPESANSSKIAANYESGVLKINIPKKEESKPINFY